MSWHHNPHLCFQVLGKLLRIKLHWKIIFWNKLNQGKFLVEKIVADRGVLFWCCKWTKISNVFQKYFDKCRYLKIIIIVFDGYASSTKDPTPKSKSAKVSQVVEIHEDNCSPSDRTEFFTSYVNKQSLIDCLGKKLEEYGFQVVYCRH